MVITPEREIIVVDTGGLPGRYDTGERILVPFLRWLGADRVDLLILSHGHLDHAGGAAALSRWFPIYSVALPPDLWPSAPDLAGEEEIPTKEVAIMQQVKQFGQLNKIANKPENMQKREYNTNCRSTDNSKEGRRKERKLCHCPCELRGGQCPFYR